MSNQISRFIQVQFVQEKKNEIKKLQDKKKKDLTSVVSLTYIKYIFL